MYRFDGFELDPPERTLTRNGVPVPLSARYFDVLVLLVEEQGGRVSRERFFGEVWSDVVVGDAALTQAVKTIRQALGDDAAQPHFIETVPRHGYRFIADVEVEEALAIVEGADLDALPPRLPLTSAETGRRRYLRAGAGRGAAGGALAGIGGGIFYGVAAAWTDPESGLSLLVVLTGVNVLVAMIAGAGVGAGVAAGRLISAKLRGMGAALGGLVVGAVVHFVATEAFELLFGVVPPRMTGALEGAVLGAAVWLGAQVAARHANYPPRRRVAVYSAITTSLAALGVVALGGTLMGGSLDALAGAFSESQLSLGVIGVLLGEEAFGPMAQAVTAAMEGAIFGGAVGGALRRWLIGERKERRIIVRSQAVS